MYGVRDTISELFQISLISGSGSSASSALPTPEQYRLREDGKVSILIFHDVGKLRGLMIFPSIFSGKHLKYTNQMTILEGKTIQVKYNEPAPLQIDGEVVPEVMEYTVRSCVSPAEKAKQDSEMAAV